MARAIASRRLAHRLVPEHAGDRCVAPCIGCAPASSQRVPGATDVQLRYVNSPTRCSISSPRTATALISDGSLRQVLVPLDELVNDLRLLRNFEIGGQRHDIAIGVYYAKVDETFERYSANALLDVRDSARLLDVVAVNAAGDVLATVTEDGITRYGSEFAERRWRVDDIGAVRLRRVADQRSVAHRRRRSL